MFFQVALMHRVHIYIIADDRFTFYVRTIPSRTRVDDRRHNAPAAIFVEAHGRGNCGA